MTRATFLTLAGGTLALVLGVLAAHVDTPFHRRSTDPATAAAAVSHAVAKSLASELHTATGSRRWQLLLAVGENAGTANLPELIRAAGRDSGAFRVLATRWATLDPGHMFRSLHAECLLPENAPGTLSDRWQLTRVLFEHWIKRDSAAAIQALTDVPDFSGRSRLRATALIELFKDETKIDAGLRAMKEWGIRNFAPEMKGVPAWTARDPRHAAESVLKNLEGHAGVEALKVVAQAWAKSDPRGALKFADGLSAAKRTRFAEEVIRDWAAREPVAAAGFASARPEGAFRNALGQSLVAEWGRSDASAALAWSGDNLRGPARTEAISALIKTAAEKDLVAAANLVATMEPGAAQNHASASIFETWFRKGERERAAALEWLATLSDSSIRRAALERVQWDWVWKDPDGVRDFISGPHGALASPVLLRQVARGEVLKDPAMAMEWAGTLPADRISAAREAVLENWLAIRPEAAADFAKKLPAGETREQAIRTVSQVLVFQSPPLAAQWFRALGETDRKVAREIFGRSGLTPEQRRQLDEAMK